MVTPRTTNCTERITDLIEKEMAAVSTTRQMMMSNTRRGPPSVANEYGARCQALGNDHPDPGANGDPNGQLDQDLQVDRASKGGGGVAHPHFQLGGERQDGDDDAQQRRRRSLQPAEQPHAGARVCSSSPESTGEESNPRRWIGAILGRIPSLNWGSQPVGWDWASRHG